MTEEEQHFKEVPKMSYDEMIEVIEGAKQGKPIQHSDSQNDWRLCNPSVPKEFMFYGNNRYRIAPEPRKPREWKIAVTDLGELVPAYGNYHRVILVREVIDDPPVS